MVTEEEGKRGFGTRAPPLARLSRKVYMGVLLKVWGFLGSSP